MLHIRRGLRVTRSSSSIKFKRKRQNLARRQGRGRSKASVVLAPPFFKYKPSSLSVGPSRSVNLAHGEGPCGHEAAMVPGPCVPFRQNGVPTEGPRPFLRAHSQGLPSQVWGGAHGHL